jgi:hypothetical protein
MDLAYQQNADLLEQGTKHDFLGDYLTMEAGVGQVACSYYIFESICHM